MTVLTENKKIRILTALILSCSFASSVMADGRMLDFSKCVIVTDKDAGKLEKKAVSVLQEEIEKRTGIKPEIAARAPAEKTPVIKGFRIQGSLLRRRRARPG